MPSLYTSTGRSEVTGASGAIVDKAGSDSFPFAMLYANSRRKKQLKKEESGTMHNDKVTEDEEKDMALDGSAAAMAQNKSREN